MDYKARRRLMKSVKEPGTGGPGLKDKAKETLWKVYIRDGDWRRTARHLLLLEDAWSAVVEEFRPDVIHAHDMHTPGIGVRIADRIERSGGMRPKVVYDAHEFVDGVFMPTQRKLAYTGLEREFVRRADAVATVSGVLADMLMRKYRLPERPTVVANAPMIGLEPTPGGGAPSLRAVLGLADGVPLLVYSGALSPARGVDVAVEALPLLEGVHLAVVAVTSGTRTYVRWSHVRVNLAWGTGCTPRLCGPSRGACISGVGDRRSDPDPAHGQPRNRLDHQVLRVHARPSSDGRVGRRGDGAEDRGAGLRRGVRSSRHRRGGRRRAARTGRGSIREGRREGARRPGGLTPPRTPDELLAENSWEGQAEILVGLYAGLAGRRPQHLSGRRSFAETE
ncbi:glycosyltransferase [Yinghuangia aomiensis]